MQVSKSSIAYRYLIDNLKPLEHAYRINGTTCEKIMVLLVSGKIAVITVQAERAPL
ncbi:MAG: hypothetical protein M3530_00450 [Thermoproteota archaeon]|nr:hypothetical protein [Thermoproteota archaeon]